MLQHRYVNKNRRRCKYMYLQRYVPVRYKNLAITNTSRVSCAHVERIYNKCIRDDTKVVARQSLNCIKNQKEIKYGEERFSIWLMELILHPAMWHDRDIDFAKWQHPTM